MRLYNSILVVISLSLLTACGTTVLSSGSRTQPPANTMQDDEGPVPAKDIKTWGDGFKAASINGQRLNMCIIRHTGLKTYEESLTTIDAR